VPVGETDADEGDEIEEAGHAQQGVEPTLVLNMQKYGDKTKAKVGFELNYEKTSVVGPQRFQCRSGITKSMRSRIHGLDDQNL
jgi:hypothetical protein